MIMLPQARGGVMVTAILAFIEAWNEFLFASVLTGSQTRTVPVAIFSFPTTEESLWGLFTVTGVMIMAPVVDVRVLNRHVEIICRWRRQVKLTCRENCKLSTG
jgi:multiple sugar transport system permease protein